MIDTKDLTSYIPGYEEWYESQKSIEEYDNSDFIRDELFERKEQEKMERKIIDLSITNMTGHEILQLKNYVWKGILLIPQELIGD